ncbi:hypothetical protein KY319_00950 [Candidatus Woesearchaeota archaeon]|nr:hypothetical protein [Candidatus Woesearchaeota archaeon]
MAISFADISNACYGACAQQIVFVGFNNRFISLSGLFETINKLYEENPREPYISLRRKLAGIINEFSDTIEIEKIKLTEAEFIEIKAALKQYKGPCDLYFMLTNKRVYNSIEFIEYYTKRFEEGEEKDKPRYRLRASVVTNLRSQLDQLDALLTKIKTELGKPQEINPIKREVRGYDLSEEERIAKNLEFLKGGFKEKIPGERQVEMTLGRYYSGLPKGMDQDHIVLAIDVLTGMIFPPSEIQREASFFSASYKQTERDAITLDYVFAEQNPMKEQTISLPKGYRVLPLMFLIERDKLSAEARKVLEDTEKALFVPVLQHIIDLRKRKMSTKMFERLLKLEEELRKKAV